MVVERAYRISCSLAYGFEGMTPKFKHGKKSVWALSPVQPLLLPFATWISDTLTFQSTVGWDRRLAGVRHYVMLDFGVGTAVLGLIAISSECV